METFGQRLVLAREHQNLSQKELAEKLGITPTRLNYWEKDKREPAIDMIKAIAQTLEVDTNFLVGLHESDQKTIKKSPGTTEATPGDDVLEMFNFLNRGLVSSGLLGENDDITEQQAEILISVARILHATFNKD